MPRSQLLCRHLIRIADNALHRGGSSQFSYAQKAEIVGVLISSAQEGNTTKLC